MHEPARAAAPLVLSGLGAAAIDALPINLYVVDRRLRIVFWNSERERGPLGRPREVVLGRPLHEALSPHGFSDLRPVLERVFTTGEPLEETIETGDRRLFHVRRLPVREGGEVTHVLCWYEDITERRALEMQVIASDRLAFLGQLVAGVAHEISNPLAGIAGCAEALASLALRNPSRKARKEATEFRELIRNEVGRCERIVRSLLDSARPAGGDTADVAGVVRSALKLLERHPAFRRLKVVAQIAPRVPSVRIEPDSLRQVIIALAVNAARAMDGQGTLTVRASRDGREVQLDILDTGPGVPPELVRRVFQPFFTTSPEGGTGLGLAIARSLVRARGGDLTYEPPPGPGACFRVRLKTGGDRP